jgi:hypothetical protein
MRARAWLIAVCVVAAGCGAGFDLSVNEPAADRSVDESWDASTAALRSRVVDKALDDGLTRAQAGCLIDRIGTDIDLEDLLDFDLSARTGSEANSAEAELLAGALAECGPSPAEMLATTVPGVLDVPPSHAAPGECFVNAYVDALVDSYADRFAGRTRRGPHEPDLQTALRACDAAGALVLGASHAGHPEVSSLGTLEWDCLVSRLPASAFEPLFPFPDEPGDAVRRLESSADDDVAYCEALVAGTPVED